MEKVESKVVKKSDQVGGRIYWDHQQTAKEEQQQFCTGLAMLKIALEDLVFFFSQPGFVLNLNEWK